MLSPPANDNAAAPRLVPIVGFISGDGEVTLTHTSWRQPASIAEAALLFPNDPREA